MQWHRSCCQLTGASTSGKLKAALPIRQPAALHRRDKRMAKVLLFSYWPVFTPEGMACSVGLRVWGLARALSARGHQVSIAEPAQIRPNAAPSPLDPRIE